MGPEFSYVEDGKRCGGEIGSERTYLATRPSMSFSKKQNARTNRAFSQSVSAVFHLLGTVSTFRVIRQQQL